MSDYLFIYLYLNRLSLECYSWPPFVAQSFFSIAA